VLARNQVSGAFALVVLLALLASACGSSGTLSASALTKESTALQSLAAEGALLARDSAAGRTTGIYTRVHSQDLYKVASKSAKSLQSATTKPALQPKLRMVASLASKVSADLKRLGHASKAEQSRLAHELEASAKELG
jgi:uncharacterized protein (UPF0333 family)